jgi:signal peptidase I
VTIAPDRKRDSSPWHSVWFAPGDTIERVLAEKPRLLPNLVLLAAVAVAYPLVAALVGEGITDALLDWRFLAGGAVVAVVAGIVSLYFNAFVMRWSGRPLGGRASSSEMRAVVAWGAAPLCAALAIHLVAVVLLIGNKDPAPAVAIVVLRVIGLAMGIWTMIATIAMLKRVQAFGWWRAIFNYAVGGLVVPALLIALPIRTFLFQPFSIPAGSMVPTLLVGDYIFVSKYAYGYTRFSLPFSPPLFTGRLFPAEPQRGDIVVFRLPRDPATDYVKRIVGLPGDRIQMKDGVLLINDVPVQRERVEDYIDQDSGQHIRHWRETLPNGVSYFALDLQDNGTLDNTDVYTAPRGHYFMLGDNLDNSTDSRALRAVGYVPFENLIGRAEIIYFSVGGADGKRRAIRFERLGQRVR